MKAARKKVAAKKQLELRLVPPPMPEQPVGAYPSELLGKGLLIDLFAGGGGASKGTEAAYGRPVDIAINHSKVALAVHAANHPRTHHYSSDIWAVRPDLVTRGLPVEMLWASPDCRHFSNAKGDVPRDQKIRSLPWAVIKWAKAVRPWQIGLENVREFLGWGPLDKKSKKPIRSRKGETFKRWKRELELLGYVVEYRILDASHYGTPTRRKRLFLIARRDDQPIVWPDATHGPGLVPFRTAAECIDWSLECRSIFERDKPLADKTMWRIAQGIRRFVLENPRPFILKVNHGKWEPRHEDTEEPLSTVTAQQRGHALVTPIFAEPGQRHSRGEAPGDAPLSTIVAKDRHAVVVPHLTKFQQNSSGQPADEPLDTVMAGAQRFGVVEVEAAAVVRYQSGADERYLRRGQVPDEPLSTLDCSNRFGLAAVTLQHSGNGERPGQRARTYDPNDPLGTVMATGQKHALVSALISRAYGDPMRKDGAGGTVIGKEVTEPLPTVTARNGGNNGLAAVTLAKFRGTHENQPGSADVREPMPTVSAGGEKGGVHVGEVRAFLTTYYGSDGTGGQSLDDPMRTITTKHRLGLVTIEGVDYQITDIGFRMLEPEELLRAQFGKYAATYDLRRARTKRDKVKLIGNSAPPELVEALLVANRTSEERRAA